MNAPHPLSPADANAFKTAMREHASGVAVVTAGAGEARCGLAATSVVSLCVEPPTLIVCVARGSSTLPTMRAAQAFGVNLLAASQRDIAERFAGRDGRRGAARFEGADWTTLATGAPILVGALAAFDCTLEEAIERHSHAILIGRVRAVRSRDDAAALVWRRGAYAALGWDAAAAQGAVGL